MSDTIEALAMLGLGAALYAQAAQAGYSRAVAACLMLAATAQAGIAVAFLQSPAPLLLALIVLAVAASGASFLQRGNARDVLLVGGSLAGVQGLAPMGGLLAAMLIPVLAGMPKSPGAIPRQSGLYLLLCFVPVLAAVSLAAFARAGHANPVIVLHLFSSSRLPMDGLPPRSVRIALGAAGLAIAAPAAIATLGEPERRKVLPVFPLLVGVAVVAANLTATLLGVVRNPTVLTAPLAVTSLLAVCRWPRSNPRHALAVSACSLVLAAAYAGVAVPYMWAL